MVEITEGNLITPTCLRVFLGIPCAPKTHVALSPAYIAVRIEVNYGSSLF
ncbi:hypothetical protein LDG_5710 [Legionella drancourtii LLAP12]|uniref:Uncharacterized protein n=1 Tax=Legionella drancourtii LLAP12 TaxID=658187 RepID=G9EKH6_9GAMM|nr:hypothetical protein LDG_5710 [Legionella drancourtii LLAP12]